MSEKRHGLFPDGIPLEEGEPEIGGTRPGPGTGHVRRTREAKRLYELVIGGELIRAHDEEEARRLIDTVLGIILGDGKGAAKYRERLRIYVDVRERPERPPEPKAEASKRVAGGGT